LLSNVVALSLGGVWALLLTNTNFSISAAVGFISIFGVAIMNRQRIIQRKAAFFRCGQSQTAKRAGWRGELPAAAYRFRYFMTKIQNARLPHGAGHLA
jgi:Cu/Ag efflux pump CusA